ncbi:MAG: hypothetical protein KKD77_21510 [Gammaproteobacteria bacterium]|nr:hypothetical protein [Gammaproteobacteria bacterium]
MSEITDKSQENRKENHKSNGDFAPGNCANPAGRPKKGDAWRDIYNEVLDSHEIELLLKDRKGNEKEIYLRAEGGKTFRYAIVIGLVKAAMGGDVRAAQELADRTGGKPKQTVELEGNAVSVRVTTGQGADAQQIKNDLDEMR